jgi:hypothetical protein
LIQLVIPRRGVVIPVAAVDVIGRVVLDVEMIVARFAVQGVGAAVAVDVVIVVAAVDDVVAVAAVDRVDAGVAVEKIAARAAGDRIIAQAAADAVRRRAAGEDIVSVLAEKRDGVADACRGDRVSAAADDDRKLGTVTILFGTLVAFTINSIFLRLRDRRSWRII